MGVRRRNRGAIGSKAVGSAKSKENGNRPNKDISAGARHVLGAYSPHDFTRATAPTQHFHD
jgi:hypothetical protein